MTKYLVGGFLGACISAALLPNVVGCNVSKGDAVSRLSDGATGKVLFIYSEAGWTDMCVARIILDKGRRAIISETYGSDWVVIK